VGLSSKRGDRAVLLGGLTGDWCGCLGGGAQASCCGVNLAVDVVAGVAFFRRPFATLAGEAEVRIPKGETGRYFWVGLLAIGVDVQVAGAQASCCGVNLAVDAVGLGWDFAIRAFDRPQVPTRRDVHRLHFSSAMKCCSLSAGCSGVGSAQLRFRNPIEGWNAGESHLVSGPTRRSRDSQV